MKLPTFAGDTDPREFFKTYETAMESCGGGEAIKAKAFPMAAEGIAGAWYTRLPPGSISSWGQLREQILVHFRGNHAKPVNSSDLHACVQREGESLADYTRRFIHLKCQATYVNEATVFETVIQGLRLGAARSEA